MSEVIYNSSTSGGFEKEKTYKLGTQIFNIKHEYAGKKKLGEVIADMIIKKETAIRQSI